MGVETENNEIAAKGFENTDFVICILVVRVSREILPVGYLKGRYKSEFSLMTCVAELHGSVIRMPSSILSDIGTLTYCGAPSLKCSAHCVLPRACVPP